MSNQTTETTIVTDRFGNVDIAYYEREAMRMRNEYLRNQAGDLFKSLRRSIQNLFGSSATPSNA